MGWTCQHDFKGHCKLLNLACVPGIKGCILNKGKTDYIFSTGSYEEDKKREDAKSQEIDFAALARSN